MAKKKTLLDQMDKITDAHLKLQSICEALTIQYDGQFFGKNFDEVFEELIENQYYEVGDAGKTNAGYKKIIYNTHLPFFRIIAYHDDKKIINTVVFETIEHILDHKDLLR